MGKKLIFCRLRRLRRLRRLSFLVGATEACYARFGRGGSRTPVTIAGKSAFETDAFGHSATLPQA
jgi:hypothetical protein